MSIQNPTTLRLGLRGELAGKRYRVAARVVLSVGSGEEEYFWNEFRLLEDSGAEATLVFEETEKGPSWKLFTLFEPGQPLAAVGLRGLRAGQNILVDGLAAKVEYADRSRVRHIEGEPPEGVQRGDQADFVNAWMGDDMLVVSWTGEEVECFLGQELPEPSVLQAFGLQRGRQAGVSSLSYDKGEASSPRTTNFTPKAFLVFFCLVLILWGTRGCEWSSEDSIGFPNARKAPEQAFALGYETRFEGRAQVMRCRALVEFASPAGNVFGRLYRFASDDGVDTELVQGLLDNPNLWGLLTRVALSEELTPTLAATYMPGRLVPLGTRNFNVLKLLRLRVVANEGDGPGPGSVRYGFLAKDRDGYLLVDWDDKGLRARLMRTLDAAALKSFLAYTP